jgi:hypothetical protein
MKIVTREAYEVLVDGAEVLEKDRQGPKILASGGRIVKLMRVRRRISTNLLFPHALRFSRNAQRLAERGVRSLTVELAGRLPHLGCQVVVYGMLPGNAIRSLPVEGGEGMMRRFGRYLAEIHERGVYFRSLHLGNVLYQSDDGGFALIDILDLKVGRWPLGRRRRRGNILRLLRYEVDRTRMAAHWREFREGYEGWVRENAPGRMREVAGIFAAVEGELGAA